MLKIKQDFVYSGKTILAGEMFNYPPLEAFLIARGLAEKVPDPVETEVPPVPPEPEPAKPKAPKVHAKPAPEPEPEPVAEDVVIKLPAKGKAKLNKRAVAHKPEPRGD